jgi:hypothetical protein
LFEGPAGANQPAGITDSSADAYSKMITVFIPLLVDEVVLNSAHFCVKFKYYTCNLFRHGYL